MLEAFAGSCRVPIAWDKPDGKKLYGLYSDKHVAMENIMQNPVEKRWGYEFIPVGTPCLAYADIELVCSNPDPERVILSSIVSVIRAHIRKVYGRTGEFYIAEGSRLMGNGSFKVSFHLVIADIVFACNHDGNMKNLFTISDPALYFTDSDGSSKYCIDLSVYTKNRLFRLPNCCKFKGVQVPLLRINADPMDDEFTDQGFEIEDLLPFFVGNPQFDEDAVFVPSRPAPPLPTLKRDQCDAPAGTEGQRPAKQCKIISYDSKPLPFPVVILRNLLVDAGDKVSHPTKVSYKGDEQQWQIQCDQQRQQRACLVNPQETHKSNNCIIFVQKYQGQFRCQVHCTASSCCNMKKYVFGYVAMGPDLEWQYGPSEDVYPDDPEAVPPPACAVIQDTQAVAAIPSPARDSVSVASSDDTRMGSGQLTTEMVVQAVCETKKHSKLPCDNTYDVVKKRFEETCFKVLCPSEYAIILPGKYEPERMGAVLLKQHFSNLYYFGMDKKMMWEKRLFIDTWIADEDRRQVTEIVVDPVCKRTDVYNMWRPFAAALLPPVSDAEVEKFVEPILKHISDVIVVGNVAHLNWVVDFLANMVQRPERKAQVAISLYGVEGCGKGIVFEFFRRCILGDFCSYQTSDPDTDLFGRFANGSLHRVCIQVDEVKSLHEHGCRLKDFITNNTINYECKGKNKIVVSNLANLILTSNNENALAVSPEDRRFSLFRCSAIHKTNKGYFIQLAAHLAKQEVASAFFQYLLSRDLSHYVGDFQASRPITEYYKETQLANITPIMRFLSGVVNDGGEPIEIAARRMYEAYQNFHTSGNYKFIMSEASFGREVKRIAGITTKRITAGIMYQLDKKQIKSFLQDSNRYDPDA